MFLITAGSGFQITFENGYRVSVYLDEFNQCSRCCRNYRSTDSFTESAVAETVLISPRGDLVRYGNGIEQLDMTADNILDLLNYAAQLE